MDLTRDDIGGSKNTRYSNRSTAIHSKRRKMVSLAFSKEHLNQFTDNPSGRGRSTNGNDFINSFVSPTNGR